MEYKTIHIDDINSIHKWEFVCPYCDELVEHYWPEPAVGELNKCTRCGKILMIIDDNYKPKE